MNQTRSNLTKDEGAVQFSKLWIIAIAIVAIYGFALLLTITFKAYDDKPPIPDNVVNLNGEILFTGQDIREGQAIFLRYGLMDNGTVWGHGAYLGPDFPALYLNRMAKRTAELISLEQLNTPYENLNKEGQLLVDSQVSGFLKQNNYDQEGNTLIFLPSQEISFYEEPELWRQYFSDPIKNGGLKANLITDSTELRQLTAFFAWTAWASVTLRPDSESSYTNNFPYDELAGNKPTSEAVVWSVASLLFLLIGIGGLLFVYGKNSGWGWAMPNQAQIDYTRVSLPSHSQKALVKFIVVAALLFLGQTLVGGGVAHYRANPGNFYGLDISNIFPSSLLRTWHLQLAIFWIATGFAAGGLYLARVLGGIEFKGQRLLTNILFGAFAVVIFGSLLCEWAGLMGCFDSITFWLGSQGWEYLELGRLWQILLIIGLAVWFVLAVRASAPGFKRQSTKTITIFFWIAALGIPLFYLPALFYDNMTNFTIVDTWRFWIIHLWVEGFFELFATVMVAVMFIELGIVSKKTGLMVIFLDVILIFMGGIIGTGHHWYFSGQTSFNMALSGCFSALEVVPLILLTLEGYSFMKLQNSTSTDGAGFRHKWTIRERKSVVQGTSVFAGLDIGGCRSMK